VSDQQLYVASLAPLYDAFKAGDDLPRLVDLLLDPINRYGTGGTQLLDVGCGTAASCIAFAGRGYQVTGVDASPEMLAQARSKSELGDVRLVLADMRELPPELVGFDVVNWTGDVVNHLLTAEDVRAATGASARALRPGGVLVFDANSLTAFNRAFTEQHVQEQDDALFAWLGETSEPTCDGPASARIIAFQRQPGGDWKRTEGRVEERHHSTVTIQTALRAAGLEHLATYGLRPGALVTPADEQQHGKVVYFARRPIV
jgi:SAM-dependent methyltransferase